MKQQTEMTRVIERYTRALTEKEPKQLEGLFYPEDSVAIFPNAEVAVGSEEMIQAHQAWFADSDWKLKVSVESETDFEQCRSVFLKIDYSDKDASGKPYDMEFYLSVLAVVKDGKVGIGQIQATLIH